MADAALGGDPVALVTRILEISQGLSDRRDVNAILDRILAEARALVNAEAGTIFLVDGDVLRFGYVHNEVLSPPGSANKAVYADFTVPIDDHSIVGYAATAGECVLIDDAYCLGAGVPYAFNRGFDEAMGYRTRSIVAMPLRTHGGRVLGVMEIINARDAAGAVRAFPAAATTYLPLFAGHAAAALERGLMTRELILRMVRMAQLRDPQETGAHVERAGTFAAEIYDAWARRRQVDESELKHRKDLIRLAAMLHDVGKVGISDEILKKPGRLTAEEFATMKLHTVYGARLFSATTSRLDTMAQAVALRHHERWDGTGYPGRGAELDGAAPVLGVGLRGEEIPLPARITALADVFDALCSRRAYKDVWDDDRILAIVAAESGRHFDPDVVDAFLSVFDVITAIREKYRDTGGAAGGA